jgi:hypothetical protein
MRVELDITGERRTNFIVSTIVTVATEMTRQERP